MVYRGKSVNAESVGGNLQRWVKQNYAKGREVNMKSYHSATTSKQVAYNQFAGGRTEDGVVFEMLTPEGINITARSKSPEEQEVLLPRDATYRVVSTEEVKDPNGVTTYFVRMVATNKGGMVLDGGNYTNTPRSISAQLDTLPVEPDAERDYF